MGFDVNRFKSPLVKEIPHFFCRICENVFDDPRVVSTCGHVFCKDCIESRAELCPVDGQSFRLESLEEEGSLQRKLGDLDISCDFAVFGCDQTVKMKHLSIHRKECPFSPNGLVECPDKCGASFERKHKETHSCAAHLLDIIRDNQKLVEIIVMKKSRQGIEMVKTIINDENRINEKLNKLMKMVSKSEAVVKPILPGIKQESEDVPVQELNSIGIKEREQSTCPVDTRPGTSRMAFEVIFEQIKTEKDENDDHELVVIDDEDDEEQEEAAREEHRLTSNGQQKAMRPKRTPRRESYLEEENSNSFAETDESREFITKYTSRAISEESRLVSGSGLSSTPSTSRDYTKELTLKAQSNEETRRLSSGAEGSTIDSETCFSSENSVHGTDEAKDGILINAEAEVEGQKEEDFFTVNNLDLTCEYCHNNFNRKSHLMAHNPCYFTARGITGKKKMRFDCQFCDKRFNDLIKFRQHLVFHLDRNRYKCNVCDRGFFMSGHAKVHVRLHLGNRRFKCKVCSKSFVQMRALNFHLESDHKGKKRPTESPRIKSSTSEVRKDLRVSHVRSLEPNRVLSFNLLSNADKIKFEPNARPVVKQHLQMPADDDEWVQKSLRSKGKRADFLMKRMSFTCDLCSISFNRQSLLMAHQPCYSQRTGIKGKDDVKLPYHCEFCSHRCNELNNLRKHLEFHVDINIYKCIDCGKRFTRENGIRIHQRLHSGHRPYQCRYCPKNFAQSTSFSDHLRVHTGEKPFKCSWIGCRKSFSSITQKLGHVRRIHKRLKQHLCTDFGCNKGFVTPRELKIHVRRHHSIGNS